MKTMKFIASFVVAVSAVFALSSFICNDSPEVLVQTETGMFSHVQGMHCTGTVGCSCSGFRPITDGQVWQEAYCKNCGHHKRCHK